jgi:hypothetical protein
VRLLVVTYYFPPSGGAGVQRPLKWVRYLPDAGVEPVVLTVRAGAYPALDESLLADVPPGVRVERTAAPDPFGLYGRATGRSRGDAVQARTGRVGESPALAERVSRWIRANVFVPDARVGWVPFARRRARALHRAQPFDAVLTTGPPHSAHLVGRALRRRLGLPWVADLRDPWSDIHYTEALRRHPAAQRLDERLEASVLREADALLTVSEPLRASLAARAGGTPVHLVRNGFDPADFAAPPPPLRRDVFEIVYTGTLYDVPHGLLRALAALRREGEADLHLRLIGSVPPALGAAAHALGLGDRVHVEPAVCHDEAVRQMRGAALLLLTIEPWSYADAVVPGKTYEYLASGRPVLGLGPPGGDAARVLRETGAGEMLGPEDDIASALRAHVAAWRRGEGESRATAEALAPFARPAQARAVAEIIRDICPPRRG